MDPGVKAKPRWCWNWQTGMVEGHMPLGRAGSIPAQRIEKPPLGGFFLRKYLFSRLKFDYFSSTIKLI